MLILVYLQDKCWRVIGIFWNFSWKPHLKETCGITDLTWFFNWYIEWVILIIKTDLKYSSLPLLALNPWISLPALVEVSSNYPVQFFDLPSQWNSTVKEKRVKKQLPHCPYMLITVFLVCRAEVPVATKNSAMT